MSMIKIKNDQADNWIFDIEGVKAGRVAVSYPARILETIKKNYISEDFQEDIDFHISKTGTSQPFFNIINRFTFNDSMAKTYDLV